MNKKLSAIVIALLVINMCATAVLGVALWKMNKAPAQSGEPEQPGVSTQYVMYIGTNDKDTYEQIIPTDDAKAIVDGICFKYLEGYTIQDAIGSWVDEKGLPTHENTIVCYFDGTDQETVHKIADEVIVALNQNSVLIEEDQIHTEYYS